MGRVQEIWRIAFWLWVGSTVAFMAAMSIASALFFAACLYGIYRSPKQIPWRNIVLASPYIKVTAFLISVALLSFLSAWLFPPLGVHITDIKEIRKFRYFVLPIFVAITLLHLNGREQCRVEVDGLWKILFLCSLAVSFVALFQFWAGAIFGEAFLAWGGHFFRRVAGSQNAFSHGQGLMGFHLSFASAMCFPFCYVWAKTLWWNPAQPRQELWRWLALSFIFGMAIFCTFSRIVWFALAASVILLVFFRKPRWAIPALGAVAVLAATLWFSSPDMRFRFRDAPGWLDRLQVFHNSWEMFKDRPILGVGFAKSGYFASAYAERIWGNTTNLLLSHAHNNLLDTLATTGIIGAFAFLAWWACLLILAWQAFQSASEKDRWLPASLFVAGVAFQINGLTQVNFYDAKSQHSLVLWAGLILALAWRKDWLAQR